MSIPPFHCNAFERGLAIYQAGADAALDVLGFHGRTVVNQDDVAGFQRGFHAVEGKAEAEIIGRPLMSQDREHFELLL